MGNIIKKYLSTFLVVIILVMICNALNVIHPYMIKQVVDLDFSSQTIVKTLCYLFLAYFTVQVLFAVFKNIRNIIFNQWMGNILKDIRKKVFDKVLEFKMKTYQKYNSSEIYTRLTVDIDNLFDLFFNFSQIIINNVTYLIFMVVMMFLADVNLALFGAGTVIIVASVAFYFTRKIKRINAKILDKRDEENREFSEMYNKYKLTYLFGLQKKNIQKTNRTITR